ncbi:hypothetical protein [Flavobacterium sp. GCM10027622]|uniref:hypothetical protein n=1 Tax=unclassified Flavobacterium TaxID=196869 RepID=UPI00361AA8C4
MRKRLLIAFFALVSISSFSQTLTLEEFQKQAGLSGLQFEMPIGYKIKEVKQNRDLRYSFAIINSDATMEVRYSLFPIKEMLIAYEKSKSNTNEIMINPNNLHVGIMNSNGLNMTGGKMVEIGDFPTQAVKKEFNADYGGSGFFEFNCEFGKGYKYGQFVCLHKENIADVIITFMSNDRNTHSDLMDIPFHALKFK